LAIVRTFWRQKVLHTTHY